MGDYTECVQLEFDPSRRTYRELLESIWDRHDPFHNRSRPQYQNLILYHTKSQHQQIKNSIQERGWSREEIQTRIEPLQTFHRAENYHQKHYLRNKPRLAKLFSDYNDRELTDSRAAAKLNGYAAGYGESPRSLLPTPS